MCFYRWSSIILKSEFQGCPFGFHFISILFSVIKSIKNGLKAKLHLYADGTEVYSVGLSIASSLKSDFL